MEGECVSLLPAVSKCVLELVVMAGADVTPAVTWCHLRGCMHYFLHPHTKRRQHARVLFLPGPLPALRGPRRLGAPCNVTALCKAQELSSSMPKQHVPPAPSFSPDTCSNAGSAKKATNFSPMA